MRVSLIKSLYPCFGTKECNPNNGMCRICQHLKKCMRKSQKDNHFKLMNNKPKSI